MSCCCIFDGILAVVGRAFCCCIPSCRNRIPNSCGYRCQPQFVNEPTVEQPLTPMDIPNHPYLASQGQNGMHGDSFASGTHPASGPLGNNPQLTSRRLGVIGGECATVVFGDRGRLIAVSGNFNGFRLLLLDPETLEVLASYSLPKRQNDSIFNIQASLGDTSGGAYFHLDEKHRPVLVNADRIVQVFEVQERPNGKLEWNVAEEYNLNTALPKDARVTDAIPDWSGLIWFVTRGGIVGTINRDANAIQVNEPLKGEEIQNAIAVAPDGVFIISDFALYRYEATSAGVPTWTWREEYDRATSAKPGSINLGSGTTPTLLGDDLVAIADNADGRINVCVYLRREDVTGPRLVAKQPVFKEGRSATGNSLIEYGNGSLICGNNFGYTTPFRNPRTEPGVVRIDIAPDRKSHSVVWESDEASQTTVPKLSIGNGLIYLYTRRKETRPG